MKIIIYGKKGWPFSQQARSAYGKDAQYVDVLMERGKLEEMLKLSDGVSSVPVIVEGEKVTIGYGGSWAVWGLIVGEHQYRLFKVKTNSLLKNVGFITPILHYSRENL